MKTKVDFFLRKQDRWQEEMTLLREIVLSADLAEEFKWMHPCYTLNGKNVVLIHGFKDYVALLFHKGSLLSDPEGLLVQQTKNVQAARQLRFTHTDQINALRQTIHAYILEAIDNEKKGRKVEMKPTRDFDVPSELLERFGDDPDYQSAFEALTPGRQRGYLLYFSQAKQSDTRAARIDKLRDTIFEGKGYNER